MPIWFGRGDCFLDQITMQAKIQNKLSKYYFRNHIIGGSIGGTVTLSFGIGSLVSKHFRCYLVLLLPSLFSGRGRFLLLTVAVGILLDGK